MSDQPRLILHIEVHDLDLNDLSPETLDEFEVDPSDPEELADHLLIDALDSEVIVVLNRFDSVAPRVMEPKEGLIIGAQVVWPASPSPSGSPSGEEEG